MTKPLVSGIIPPLVTPLQSSGEFDDVGCRNLVNHVLAGGVHGVLVTGSNGEVAALPPRVRTRAVVTVADEVAGRVPVLVGVARVSLEEAEAEIHSAAAAGAAAVLVAPPFYSTIDQDAVRTFYLRVADSARIPILVYNIPAFTKVSIAPETVGELALAGAIIGIKDSSRDFDYFLHVLEVVRGNATFAAFTGSDSLIATALMMGAQGAIGMCGNFVPRWQVNIFDAVAAGNWPGARDQQRQLFTLMRAMRVGSPPSAIKVALNVLGICGDHCAAPIDPMPEAQRQGVAAALARLGCLANVGPTSKVGRLD